MSAPRIRIFSDLHYGDPRSSLHTLEEFTPLLADTDEIILNGDTLDTVAPHTAADQTTVRAFFASAGPRVTFLSGNHDPDFSPLAELSLADGRVWITHGDLLFDDIAPWSHHAPQLARHIAAAAADIPPSERTRLDTRLRIHRQACHALLADPEFFKTYPTAGFGRLFRTLFPPTRILAMLRAWSDTPSLAAALARIHRPQARVVVVGHTHRPGVHQTPGESRIITVNTGAFARPFGAAFVDLCDEHIRVVRIIRRDGAFRPGRVLADFTLPAS